LHSLFYLHVWEPCYRARQRYHRDLYEAALDHADDACKAGRLDVSKMEALIEGLLAKQLARIYELAAGKAVTDPRALPLGG
jgi:hypothetical protein